MPYDFVIKHRPGKNNPVDAPSRRPDYDGEKVENNGLISELQSKMGKVQRVALRSETK